VITLRLADGVGEGSASELVTRRFKIGSHGMFGDPQDACDFLGFFAARRPGQAFDFARAQLGQRVVFPKRFEERLAMHEMGKIVPVHFVVRQMLLPRLRRPVRIKTEQGPPMPLVHDRDRVTTLPKPEPPGCTHHLVIARLVTEARPVERRDTTDPYLTQLCQSLGASMIADPDRITIEVTVDASLVGADVSVSLGLIVTELVINALKHAFPDERTGLIVIDYHSGGDGWTLCISDNGVGMQIGNDAPKAGLGTGIVEALVKKLEGEIRVGDAGPGTVVTIRHVNKAGLPTGVLTAA